MLKKKYRIVKNNKFRRINFDGFDICNICGVKLCHIGELYSLCIRATSYEAEHFNEMTTISYIPQNVTKEI